MCALRRALHRVGRKLRSRFEGPKPGEDLRKRLTSGRRDAAPAGGEQLVGCTYSNSSLTWGFRHDPRVLKGA
jgi:hypothetical protein